MYSQMQYQITHTTRYNHTEPVPVCYNYVHLAPRSLPFQNCADHDVLISPAPAERVKQSDYFNNQVEYFSIHEPHLGLTVTAKSTVSVSPRPPLDTSAVPSWESIAAKIRIDYLQDCQFIFDSPHIRRSAQFADYGRQSFVPGRSIIDAALDLTHRIFKDFKFDNKATTVSTPVEEVFVKRMGVCQDFAHLQITCLRSLGLAARYVSGYLRTIPPPGKPRLVGADASHAWISLFCGPLGWVDFDPTNDALPGTDYVILAWGRDYSDVCPIQGVFTGGGKHTMTVSVDVLPLGS